ncbi:MAG: hypothetical protein RO257_06765 [Candidatus Kapabacteria bacterium]|nr:hypothetical protein [Candidatus Kapabacteria bacterium]
MKSILYSVFVFTFMLLISCSEDSSTNNPSSDLYGTWKGEVVVNMDTVRYSCTLTEKNGIVSGTANLFAFHKEISGNTTITETIGKIREISGAFSNGNVIVTFTDQPKKHFEGQIAENKQSITGKIFVHFTEMKYDGEYFITLNKQ